MAQGAERCEEDIGVHKRWTESPGRHPPLDRPRARYAERSASTRFIKGSRGEGNNGRGKKVGRAPGPSSASWRSQVRDKPKTLVASPTYRKGSRGRAEMSEVAKRLGEPPGRHPHLGAAKCEIAKDTAHALNRTRDLRIMRKAKAALKSAYYA